MTMQNIRLPSFINQHIYASPTFVTRSVSSRSGATIKELIRSRLIMEYEIEEAKLSDKEFELFRAFFINCKGSYHTFLFKDLCDYIINEEPKGVENMSSGVYRFKLCKTYKLGDCSYMRSITNHVANTLKITINNQHLQNTEIKDGYVYIYHKLNMQDKLNVYCEFDVPVSFCQDKLTYRRSVDNSILLRNIKFIETTI